MGLVLWPDILTEVHHKAAAVGAAEELHLDVGAAAGHLVEVAVQVAEEVAAREPVVMLTFCIQWVAVRVEAAGVVRVPFDCTHSEVVQKRHFPEGPLPLQNHFWILP